jgi:hypothetical protein
MKENAAFDIQLMSFILSLIGKDAKHKGTQKLQKCNFVATQVNSNQNRALSFHLPFVVSIGR